MRLVAVEGIDCSGKTTLVAALMLELPARGVDASAHREPGDGPIGRLFRQFSANDGHSPHTLALLSAADRHDRQAGLAQQSADVVISDRYYLSGLAYHAVDGVDLRFYQRLNVGVRRPDLYLFLHLDPAVAVARRSGRASDRWESEAIASAVPAAYERALSLVHDTEDAVVTRLDAAQPPAAVLAQALTALIPLMPAIKGADCA